jgi:hypothetical protein
MKDLRRFLRAEWDRLAGYGCVAAGVVLLVAGFVGVRTSADVIDEISYLVTGGIGSIFLLGVGATLLLSADLHDDFRKLHRVEEKLDRVERLLQAQHPEFLDVADGSQVGPPDLPDSPPDEGPADRPEASAEAEPSAAAAAVGARATLAVRRGRLIAGIGVAVAAVLFVAGALRTANEASTDHMAGPVGVALAGALLVALVAALMVAQLRGVVEQRKSAVFGSWLGATGCAPAALTAVDADRAQPVAVVFAVPGLPLYHRAGCGLLDGRAATEVTRAALPAGAVPCRLCEPN